jgi:class 3 adenylate cyclase/ligand-binding sensor domain-containing protein
MLRFAAILALLTAARFPLLAALSPEAGAFLFQSYTPKDYNANPQNWSAVQDARGVIYFANTDCLLQFDGVTWRKIPLPNNAIAVALAIDSRGTVFVGAQGVFGYLAPGSDGTSTFVSLLTKVKPDDRAFNEVWDVLPTSDGVYFAAHNRLFLYTSGGDLRTFRPASKSELFGRAFAFHDELYVTSTERGLLTIQAGSLNTSRVRADEKVVRADPVFAEGALPLLGERDSLYRFSLGSIDPFPTAADTYFKTHNIYTIKQLPGGDIAVGTVNGGLVLLNQNGGLERIVRKADGLPSDSITSIYSDRQNGIWLTTDSGIARFVFTLSGMEERAGLHGNVYALARVKGVLYVGTALGLFQMHTVPSAEPRFDPVTQIQKSVFATEGHGDQLFVGANDGLYVIAGTTVQHVREHVVYGLGFSQRASSVLYTAGREGVVMLKKSGNQWTVLNSLANQGGSGQDFRSVVEAPDGAVWATSQDAIVRIDFSSQPAKAERFNAVQGVPPSWKYAYLLRGHVVFATSRGLLRFSEPDHKFLPDDELGLRFSNGSLAISTVREDAARNVWITGDGYHGILHANQWFGEPLLGAGLGELYALQLDSDGVAWAAGTSGKLFRYRQPRLIAAASFQTLLRSAILTSDETPLFNGDGAMPVPRLPYRDNAIRFAYAAPFFEDQASVDYQFRLGGTEKQWSPWTKETRKDYTNLPERAYTFEVRARNPHGIETRPVSFKFTLLAPWYRTWWAYALYLAGFLFAGWMILRWRLRALEARNKWLENVVEERTAEVRTERDQNEALLLNILPKPVASELRSTGSVKPTSFDDVTVCFSDFVGFTLSSEKLPPQELISSLNDYFTAFDEIIGRYGLEKLKTIGDAYMFAGGLPNASPSHAVDAVLAALEMVEVVRKLAKPEKGINWSIRLGLYSGPVVAGVVGVRKFAFDIWGNTVNFAARMESAGAANRVNLSETTGSRVFDFIECEARGPVRIKEGREMEMYFAIGLKQELLAGPMIDGIPEAFRHKYEELFAKPPRSFPNLANAESTN